MRFQYYHGTSDIFLDSIIQSGLGGINPNSEFKHLETLKFLFELAERHLIKNESYKQLRDTTKAMVLQGILEIEIHGRKERLNFRHEGTYIALSEIRAISYACNKYGSEIVTRSISLMALLDQIGIDYSNPELAAINRFQQFRLKPPKPILIKIAEVDEERLDKEDGKTAKEALDFLRNVYHNLSEKERFEFFQYCNFKLWDPIPVDRLNFILRYIFD
jgi:hypothetical protein